MGKPRKTAEIIVTAEQTAHVTRLWVAGARLAAIVNETGLSEHCVRKVTSQIPRRRMNVADRRGGNNEIDPKRADRRLRRFSWEGQA